MAHYQQQKFVAAVKSEFPEFFTRVRVLEVGSWNVTGTVRDHFEGCDYVGADVAAGPGVDLVVPGQELGLPTGSFDTVISCECFEHNPYWLETFVNMARMLRPGGLFVFTCAGTGRGEHGTSRTDPSLSLTAVERHGDYYRNLTRRDFETRMALDNTFASHAFFDNRYAKDLYFVGVKRVPRPDPALAERLWRLAHSVTNITLPRPPSAARIISAGAEWWLKWTLARLLGEERYHDLRHALRSRRSGASGRKATRT